jgi:hypothetical protein
MTLLPRFFAADKTKLVLTKRLGRREHCATSNHSSQEIRAAGQSSKEAIPPKAQGRRT